MKDSLGAAAAIVLLASWTGVVEAKRGGESPPAGSAELPYAISAFTSAESSTGNSSRSLNDANTIVYENQFGGGGVGVGLLGPLGVAANVAAINSRTGKEAALLHDKIGIDPQDLLWLALTATPLKLVDSSDTHAALFKPTLEVTSMGDHDLRFGVSFQVEDHPAGKEWTGTYFWELRTTLTREAVLAGLSNPALQALRQEAADGFQQLVALYVRDASQTLPNGGKIKFHSPFFQPRFNIKNQGTTLAGPAGRLTVRLLRGKNEVASFPEYAVQRDE